MSLLLARLARTLTQRWKRGLAAALVVLFLLGGLAGAGGEAADDWSNPGTESQDALDLFREHSPAFAGADSTLVFSVDAGRVTDPQNPRRHRGRPRLERILPNVSLEGHLEQGLDRELTEEPERERAKAPAW